MSSSSEARAARSLINFLGSNFDYKLAIYERDSLETRDWIIIPLFDSLLSNLKNEPCRKFEIFSSKPSSFVVVVPLHHLLKQLKKISLDGSSEFSANMES